MKRHTPTFRDTLIVYAMERYRRIRAARWKCTGHLSRGLTRAMQLLGIKSFRYGAPAGTFSTLEALRKEGKEHQVIMEKQAGVEMPEGSISVLAGMSQHCEQRHPILWEHYRNAHLVSQSLALVNDQKQLNIEATYGADFHRIDPGSYYLTLPKATKLPGKWTSIVSLWSPSAGACNFAHWLYDALPRLALLKHFPEDVGILIPAKVLPFQRESLEMLGLFHRCRPTSETHLVVEDFYFSSPVSQIICWSPYAYRFLEENLFPHRSERTDLPKRFYIARRGAVKRGALNGAEVEAYFERMGWAIVDTAVFSLADQMALFYNAEAICGLHGAGLVNMQWSRPGTKVIEIFPSTFLSAGNELLAHHQKLDYKALICPGDAQKRLTVDLEALDAHLKGWGMTAPSA